MHTLLQNGVLWLGWMKGKGLDRTVRKASPLNASRWRFLGWGIWVGVERFSVSNTMSQYSKHSQAFLYHGELEEPLRSSLQCLPGAVSTQWQCADDVDILDFHLGNLDMNFTSGLLLYATPYPSPTLMSICSRPPSRSLQWPP